MRPIYALAPMAGYTDASFRLLCTGYGADFSVSEMISATALVMGDRKTAGIARIAPGEAPVVLQLFGREPETVAAAARILLSGSYEGCSYASPPAGIDLNMGCPVRKIVSNGEGCALMRDPDRAARMVAAVAEVTASFGVPLSVKCRLGWDANEICAPDFCLLLARNGASSVTLHCRTREQLYTPGVDLSVCAETVRSLRENGFTSDRFQLYGNGDVTSPASADRYLDAGCDGVAVGRAALGAPWIFSFLKDPSFVPPSKEEIVDLTIRFVEDVVREKGETVGIRESRSRAACFLHGFRGAARIRDRLNHTETLPEFTEILASLTST